MYDVKGQSLRCWLQPIWSESIPDSESESTQGVEIGVGVTWKSIDSAALNPDHKDHVMLSCRSKAFSSRLLILLNFTSLSEPESPRFWRLRAKCAGSGGSGSGSTSIGVGTLFKLGGGDKTFDAYKGCHFSRRAPYNYLSAAQLTRDLMRGGPKGPPCWFFAHNSNSVGNSALKFSVPLRTSILRILLKQFVRGHPRSKVIEVKLRSCSTVFVKKSSFR